MSLAVVLSRGLAGFAAPMVTVEVHLAGGLPAFNLVGLPETEVKESRDRVRAALQNAHFEFPTRKITVNLAPADLPKESGRFDLPIALGLLAATGQLPVDALQGVEFVGELALTGVLRPIRGALPMALAARRDGHAFVLPASNAEEAALARDAAVHPANSLLEVCAHLAGGERLPRMSSHGRPGISGAVDPATPDLADVRGQAAAKRVLAIAAAGGHSLLMVGPPGTGKSMLAQRLAGILPPMTEDEALECAALQSLTGRFRPEGWGRRPFRAPHHTASAVALVGGGSDPRPGEISLASHGVLFLDELPEWDRRVLEVLREPIESGVIQISRAARQTVFPARFQLVAAMNPCACGWLGHASGRCRCTPDQIARYRGRVSGPLIDRIDLGVEVPSVEAAAIVRVVERDDRSPTAETSSDARARVTEARERALARQGKSNAQLAPSEVDVHCRLDPGSAELFTRALARLALSARACHRILRVARTIADLAASPDIAASHVSEAIGYRRFDRA